MSDEWRMVTIGDICEVISGQSPKSSFYNNEGDGLPFYQGKKDFGEKYVQQPSTWTTEVKKTATTGDILMSVRAPVGPINLATQDICIGRGLAAIRASDEVDRHFLYYLLLSKQPEISGREGAVFASINRKQIAAINIFLPSLSDQKQIVAILDKAIEGIATATTNAEKSLQNARELFESYLESVFLRKGKDWEKVQLATLLERGWITSHLDGNHGSNYPRKSEFVSRGVFYLSANCLKNEKVDFSLAKYLSPDRAELLRKGRAQNKDVLFAHNATVGPVAILKTSENWVLLSTSLTYYRCDQNHILPEYLAHYMRSHAFKSQYKSVMRQSTRNQVPITKQREFFHVIPPLKEQKKLARQLDSLSHEVKCLQRIYDEKLVLLMELKQAVLQKAFAGEPH